MVQSIRVLRGIAALLVVPTHSRSVLVEVLEYFDIVCRGDGSISAFFIS
jgi:peptidoglycan/LPS O-acetylase OafA/YrhL